MKTQNGRLEKYQRKLVGLNFIAPLKEFDSVEYRKKGISFLFKGKYDLRAAQSGKIDYVGRLSTYGNVLIIDHGKDIRSILLGKINLKIKKGSIVKKGDIIASTVGSSKIKNAIYFEVRKRNKVQNTAFLMNDEFLKKVKGLK